MMLFASLACMCERGEFLFVYPIPHPIVCEIIMNQSKSKAAHTAIISAAYARQVECELPDSILIAAEPIDYYRALASALPREDKIDVLKMYVENELNLSMSSSHLYANLRAIQKQAMMERDMHSVTRADDPESMEAYQLYCGAKIRYDLIRYLIDSTDSLSEAYAVELKALVADAERCSGSLN